jgi:hypothetical protein
MRFLHTNFKARLISFFAYLFAAVWLIGYSDTGTWKRSFNSVKECTPLTWTKITGGIRSWPQYNHDRDDVFDPHSDIDVLAQWRTRGYFEARGKAWTLSNLLEVPPRSAEDVDFLRMTSEAYHAAAGPRDVWPSLSLWCTLKFRS